MGVPMLGRAREKYDKKEKKRMIVCEYFLKNNIEFKLIL